MKKIYIIILGVFICINLSAQVPETHMALVNPKTATWCEPCGEWGVESTELMFGENMDKAVFIELHNSDDMSNTFDTEILSNFPYAAYTPAWYVDGHDATYHTDLGQVIVYTESNVKDAVDSTYAIPPVVNSNFDFTLVGDLLTVNTTTKFFQSADGDYYLAMYVVEDDVDEDQDGAAASYRHDFTLRTGMTASETYGELISSGAVASGAEFTKTYSVTLDAEWIPSHIWLAAVIWQKVGSDFIYINAYTDYGRLAVGVNEIPVVDLGITLTTNPANAFTQAQLNAGEYINNVAMHLTDLQGREIKQLYNGSLTEGQNLIDIDVRDLASGIYLIQTVADNNSFTNKLVVIK
ncbi:MAG: Omp28-related outer membrane protein [Chitinophagales bacterium]